MAVDVLLGAFFALCLTGFSSVACNQHETAPSTTALSAATSFLQSGSHTNNWAVLVCASRFWFNYRHVANVLSLYHSVKRLGIPDSQIIMMLADDMPCNPRNPRPGTVFNNRDQSINLYGEEVEVDYRGYEVTVENFIRLLTGRLPSDTPRSKRLLTDHKSNILLYMTGHGGDGFLKFQDAEEVTSVDLADAIATMWAKNRYHEVLVIADTCQAASMYQLLYSPNVLGTGSALVGEDSLSHHVDPLIGVYVIDRYTFYTLEFLETFVQPNTERTMKEYFAACPRSKCISTVGVREDLFRRRVDRVRVTDFFGGARHVAPVRAQRRPVAEWLKDIKTRNNATTFDEYAIEKEQQQFAYIDQWSLFH